MKKIESRAFTESDLIDAYLTGYNDGLAKKKPTFVEYLSEKHGIDHMKDVLESLRKRLKKQVQK